MPRCTKYPGGFDDYIRDQVYLDKETGCLYWSKQSWKNVRDLSRPIGSVQSKRYLAFRLNYLGKSYLILNHRVVFFLCHGYWPVGVDHKDGDGFNNKPQNLREADQSANNGNTPVRTGKYKGIYFRKDRGTWQSQITNGKKSVKLGNYLCQKEAALAYNYAAESYFGDFARFNKVFEDYTT